MLCVSVFLCVGNTSAILVASDAEAAEQSARQLRPGKYGLLWTQFNDLSSFFHDRCDGVHSALVMYAGVDERYSSASAAVLV
jgi:hypothetical protein